MPRHDPPHSRPDDPPADPALAWLRDAMRLIWHQLDAERATPLVVTVVAATTDGRPTAIVTYTGSMRAPGRVYVKPVNPEETCPDA